jgi:hypothetical protein
MDKISLNVLVPRGKRDEEERYWVAGEINELGTGALTQGGGGNVGR